MQAEASSTGIASTGLCSVTLPADIKANVRLETVQGEILTDFDLVMLPNQVTRTIVDSSNPRSCRSRNSVDMAASKCGSKSFFKTLKLS